MELSSSEMNDLKAAKSLLENPGLAAKIGNVVGSPIDSALKKLPVPWNEAIQAAARKAIEKALYVALLTMDQDNRTAPSNLWHKIAVGASGATGGAFGMPALAIELPVSTIIMLRSIADIARSEGEDLRTPEAKLQCLQVLALGGNSKDDDDVEKGYFAARAAMAKAVSEAAEHVARKGLSQRGAPALVRLITQIAGRFSIVVSEKAIAQAVPVVGALSGAAINALFMDHFQDIAKGHFTVRRLEKLHGQEKIKQLYDLI